MFIETETTPNPATLKFLPGELVMASGTREFRNENEAEASPLAAALFAHGDVTGVLFGRDFVSVTAAPGVDWSALPRVAAKALDDFKLVENGSIPGVSVLIQNGQITVSYSIKGTRGAAQVRTDARGNIIQQGYT